MTEPLELRVVERRIGAVTLIFTQQPWTFAMCRLCFVPMVLAILVNGVAATDEEPDAKAILEQAIKAHGGDANLSKFVAMHFTTKGTGYEGEKKIPLKLDFFYQGNDKMRTSWFAAETNSQVVEVINGQDGWGKEGTEEAASLDSEDVAVHQEMIYMNWITAFVPLRSREFRLSPLDEISVSDRKAVGILVRHEKHESVKLYFDKTTHLLVKYERRFHNVEADKKSKEESIYSDYKAVQGTMQPTRVVTYWDGVKQTDLAVESKLYEKPLDEKLFAKP